MDGLCRDSRTSSDEYYCSTLHRVELWVQKSFENKTSVVWFNLVAGCWGSRWSFGAAVDVWLSHEELQTEWVTLTSCQCDHDEGFETAEADIRPVFGASL